ncbi:MAG: phage tail protein [Dehalococcoidales bacterium]|nr:MAG: phage tail protein [Dehalococcoidales bacterium]
MIKNLLSPLTARRVDPFPNFKFHVEVGDITEAAFTECNGLEMSTDVFEYVEGGLNEYAHKFPVRTKVSNITLKRGFATSNELYNWYREMENALRQGKGFSFRQVTITLRTTVNQYELMRWTLDKAFPVKWVGPAFKAGDAAVAIETLELAHHGIDAQPASLQEQLQANLANQINASIKSIFG